MRQLVSDRRRLRLLAGAVVAGAALFASGVFVANAMGSDDSPNDTGGPKVAVGVPRDGNSGSSAAQAAFNPAIDRGEAGMAGDEDMSRSSRPWGGCQVPITGILADGKLDPAAAGFAASYLGAGFQLTSFSIRGEADCPDGVTPSGETHIVIDTAWKHIETGLGVYVSQRQDAEPTASVLEETNARFSREGYAFSVSVDGYSVQPFADTDDGPDVARDLLPGPDPRAAEVLRAALADLNAPAEACFYTIRAGTFDDLAAMGIGDPRGAIPGGYSLQDVQVRAWNAPAADCGTPAEGLQTSFNATWVLDSSSGFGGIYASAYSVSPGEEAYPGSSSEYYANWTNGTFHFNVGVKSDPAPTDGVLLTALATALDPLFLNACLAVESELSDDQLRARGFGIPSAPGGYEVTNRAHRGSALNANCSAEARANYTDSVGGNWTMTADSGAVINVNAYQSGDVPSDEKRGYIGENNISWWAGSAQYNISGYNERGGDAPSLETLIEVARSIDPSFDPDSLEKVSGGSTSPGGPGVMPIAEDAKPR
ncbi:MAG: hypothetical protein WD557_11305 [Dehalococcoidia bacterium]